MVLLHNVQVQIAAVQVQSEYCTVLVHFFVLKYTTSQLVKPCFLFDTNPRPHFLFFVRTSNDVQVQYSTDSKSRTYRIYYKYCKCCFTHMLLLACCTVTSTVPCTVLIVLTFCCTVPRPPSLHKLLVLVPVALFLAWLTRCHVRHRSSVPCLTSTPQNFCCS